MKQWINIGEEENKKIKDEERRKLAKSKENQKFLKN